MRLSKIYPWSGTPYTPPRRVEEADPATTKPPEAREEDPGGASADPGDDPPSDDPPAHTLDITI
jgi:hypothetical protein